MLGSSVYSVPISRDVSNDEVKKAVKKDLQDIMAGDAKNLVILVAENESSERMGVLLLQLNQTSELTEEEQGQVYSLAIEPRFWGTAAASKLVREAAIITAKHGHRYLVGQISAGNRRMKLKAERMGFRVEAYEIVMACDLDGPTKMPVRPENQRAHDVSRAQRRLLAKRRARKKKREERRRKK